MTNDSYGRRELEAELRVEYERRETDLRTQLGELERQLSEKDGDAEKLVGHVLYFVNLDIVDKANVKRLHERYADSWAQLLAREGFSVDELLETDVRRLTEEFRGIRTMILYEREHEVSLCDIRKLVERLG